MSAEGSDIGSVSAAEHRSSTLNVLEELSDAELIRTIEELQTEVTQLELENQVFCNFLIKNDPILLSGMAQVLELANKLQSQTQSTLTPALERRSTDESIRSSSRRTESVVKFTTTSMAEKGPRLVNTVNKTTGKHLSIYI